MSMHNKCFYLILYSFCIPCCNVYHRHIHFYHSLYIQEGIQRNSSLRYKCNTHLNNVCINHYLNKILGSTKDILKVQIRHKYYKYLVHIESIILFNLLRMKKGGHKLGIYLFNSYSNEYKEDHKANMYFEKMKMQTSIQYKPIMMFISLFNNAHIYQ